MTHNEPHLKDEEFLAFSTGEVAGDEAQRLRRHLEACPQCAATLDRFCAAAHHLYGMEEELTTPALKAGLDEVKARYRLRHRHLGEEALVAHLLGEEGMAGEVSAETRPQNEEHLAVCPSCAAVYDALVDSRDQLLRVEGWLGDEHIQGQLDAAARAFRAARTRNEGGARERFHRRFPLPSRRLAGLAAALVLTLGTAAAAAAYVQQRSEWLTRLETYEKERQAYRQTLESQKKAHAVLEAENARSLGELEDRLSVLAASKQVAQKRLEAELERNRFLAQALQEERSGGESARELRELSAQRDEDRRLYEEETQRLRALGEEQERQLVRLRQDLARLKQGSGGDTDEMADASFIARLPLTAKKKRALMQLDPDARSYILATMEERFGESVWNERTIRSVFVEIPGWLNTFYQSDPR